MTKNKAVTVDADRYRNEADFFDREAEELLRDGRGLKFSNNLNYEQYFSLYPTYNVVKQYLGSLDGKKVLDYACGSGWTSIYFARSGADCRGFDISPVSVDVANKMAEANGVADHCKFVVSAAEKIDFPDNTFDVVFGNAALHHTDLDRSPAEIARVLRPGGKAAFIDDLRYHPVMWVYRKLTSDKHTRYETPMVQGDIKRFQPHFSRTEFDTYDFLNLFPKSKGLSAVLKPIDRGLLKVFPFLKHFYRHLVIKLVK